MVNAQLSLAFELATRRSGQCTTKPHSRSEAKVHVIQWNSSPPPRCVDFSRETVLKKLQQLNPDKSPGPGCLHSHVLKELAEELEPLVTFFLPSHYLRERSQNLGYMQTLPRFLRQETKANLEITAQSA